MVTSASSCPARGQGRSTLSEDDLRSDTGLTGFCFNVFSPVVQI